MSTDDEILAVLRERMKREVSLGMSIPEYVEACVGVMAEVVSEMLAKALADKKTTTDEGRGS